MTFTRRALVTFVTPLLFLLLGGRLLLPGMAELVQQTHTAPEKFGVFALGIGPYVIAYQLVEVVAFLVPSLSRRRHGDPALRAKLDFAAQVLAVALAAMQAFSYATLLQSLDNDSTIDLARVSVPLVLVTLVGGVCVQMVAARLISRAGLANGVAVLLAASVLQQVVSGVGVRLHPAAESAVEGRGYLSLLQAQQDATPLETGLVLFAVALAVAAAIVTLARATGMRLGSGPTRGGPYRGARELVLHPSFPVPSSSYGALLIARSLLLVPASLVAFRVPGMTALSRLLDGGPVAYVVLVLVMMVLLAFWLHRPKELADVSERLGIKTDPSLARRALVQTLLPSFLFFVVMMLAGRAAGADLSNVPILVAVLLDVLAASRLARGAVAWLPVWEERRASAVPVIRAVLAARGIESQVTGMSLLWLMQLFAPFAPAVVLVKEEDAERARTVLTSLGFAAEDATTAEPAVLKAPELAPRRRAVYLAMLVALAGVTAFGSARVRDAKYEATVEQDSGPPARLELVRVDDTLDPLADVKDSDLPDGSGISIYQETAPTGPGENSQVHFARIVARTGEPRAETRARFTAFLDHVHLERRSEPMRFAMEEILDVDEDTRQVTFIGYRSFLLVGEPELTNADVEDAVVVVAKGGMIEPSVSVTLTPKGAARFEDVTERWLQRRFAIMLDGQIESAPVIKAKITGGRLSISMGRASPEKALADARRLERSLRGRPTR